MTISYIEMKVGFLNRAVKVV